MPDLLVLVRHGDAEPFGPEGTDSSRRLTPEGVVALEHAYPDTFSRLRGRDDLRVWVSPAKRALETAEVVMASLGMRAGSWELRDSLYEQDADAFLSELGAEGDGCVIAVGHIPFMQRLLFGLTGCDLPFDKGAVAAVSLAHGVGGRGRLEWFVQGPGDGPSHHRL